MSLMAAGAVDPQTALAVSMHRQPGRHPLSLVSGTSTAVGVPPRWGVMEQLDARAQAAAGESPCDNRLDPEVPWARVAMLDADGSTIQAAQRFIRTSKGICS